MISNRTTFRKILAALLAVSAADSAVPVALAQETRAGGMGPRIEFADPSHDFGRVPAGNVVRHGFVFTNAGDATLEITGVTTSCGCTTAGSWSRQVEPGNTGTIPIEFNGENFQGPVARTIAVTSNDQNRPLTMLHVNATVWRPFETSPRFALLTVPPGSTSEVATVVRISSNAEGAVTLSDPKTDNSTLAVELRTVEPGREFELSIRTVPPLETGTHQGTVSLKTSLTEVPTLNITAMAVVRPVFSVMPPRITLPVGPLPRPMPSRIIIQVNTPDPVILTDPRIDVRGVDVQLKEIKPGKQFAMLLSFPAGFEIPRGEDVEVRVTTSHPAFQIIRVPVTQFSQPAAMRASPDPRGNPGE